MSDQAKTDRLPVLMHLNELVIEYDYDKHGGDMGDIILANDILNLGEYVKQAYIEEVVGDNPTSEGSATIALSTVTNGDILAATAYDDAVFTGTFGACKPVNTAATFVKNTGSTAVDLTMTIAGAALTGGSFKIHLIVAG